MDDAFRDANDKLQRHAEEAVKHVNALEDETARLDQLADDNVEIREHLRRLCGQLSEMLALLVGDEEESRPGLLKRFWRWARLVRADLRDLSDDERASIREKIEAVEREALKGLGVRPAWVATLVQQLREKLATAKRLNLTDAMLKGLAKDIGELRDYICRSDVPIKRQRIELIVEGVHGTIKIVADIGRLAGDPTIVMGICGLYSVFTGGRRLKRAVSGLRRMATRDAAAAAEALARQEREEEAARKAEAERQAAADRKDREATGRKIKAIRDSTRGPGKNFRLGKPVDGKIDE